MRRLSPFILCLACGADPGGSEGSGSSSSGSSSSGSSSSSSGSSSGDAAPTSGGSGGGTSSESGGEGESSESSGGSEDSGAGFVVDCGTRLMDGRLAFACNIPGVKAECDAVPMAPCADVDEDGLTDEWEDLLLGALRPVRRMDEAEMMFGDAGAVVGDVGRVARVGDHVHVYVMLGYHFDYGSCGFTSHNGDSERVVLATQADPAGGPGGVIVVGAYTAAHENTATDHGEVFTGAGLDQLVFTVDLLTNDPRWVVYPSANKHATYATVAICEDISPLPCFDEDCAPDDVDDPAMFDVLPPVLNAGEEAAPRATELSALGFPGEQAWTSQDFCGGLGGTGCSSPVRDKLTVDPFL